MKNNIKESLNASNLYVIQIKVAPVTKQSRMFMLENFISVIISLLCRKNIFNGLTRHFLACRISFHPLCQQATFI